MPDVRLIDANALAESDMAKLIDIYLYNQCNLTVGLAAALMPEIEAEPVRHGRWIFGHSRTSSWMTCSICCKAQSGQTACFSYCPNCGARMDGGADNA